MFIRWVLSRIQWTSPDSPIWTCWRFQNANCPTTWGTCGSAQGSRTALYMWAGRSSKPTNPFWQVSLIQTPSPADDTGSASYPLIPTTLAQHPPLWGAVCVRLDSTCDLDSNFSLSEVVILQYDRSRFITENLLSDAPLMSIEDD